jgi:hypothetical protein
MLLYIYIYLSFAIKRKYAKNICKSLGLFADCVCVKSEHLQSRRERMKVSTQLYKEIKAKGSNNVNLKPQNKQNVN